MGITHDVLVRFCNLDYDREMAIVAELKEGDKKKLIAIGRLVLEPGTRNGEFAIVVHDNYQGKGLGYKMMDMLIGIAQDKYMNSIYGIVLSSNERMLNATKRLGFVPQKLEEGLTKVTLELSI